MSGYEEWDEADWQDARDTMRSVEETFHGPVVGIFKVAESVSNGNHPPEVREAWKGVGLPVRARHMYDGGEVVRVLCTDGYNALVESGASNAVLQYWIDTLEGRVDENATFSFKANDGNYTALG
jgi:hypothetical protein